MNASLVLTAAIAPRYDWPHFLDPNYNPTEQDWLIARAAAQSWFTCACGDLSLDIPRADEQMAYGDNSPYTIGQPLDGQLTTMGRDFHNAICQRERTLARILFTEIKQREGELLAQMEGVR